MALFLVFWSFLNENFINHANAEQALSSTTPVSKFSSSSIVNGHAGSAQVISGLTPIRTFDVNDNIPDSAYEILNEKTDRVFLKDGKTKYKIYGASRPIYRDTDGKLKLRAPGWYLFNEMESAKIKANSDVFGYNFAVDLSDNKNIKVSAGDITLENYETIFSPKKGASLTRTNENNYLTNIFTDVYPNVDIRFHDSPNFREKAIVIKQKLENITDNQKIVFWESYTVPDGSEIYVGGNRQDVVLDITTTSSVQIKLASNEVLTISPAVIFDSKYDSSVYRDLNQKSLEQVARFDATQRKLSIGLIVDGRYLNDPDRIYPIIIDPTYTYCKGDCQYAITNIYLRNPEDNYNNTLGELYMGYYDNSSGSNVSGDCALSGTNYISRHPVFRFDSTVIPTNEIVSSAKLFATFKQRTYCGIQGSSFATRA